MALIDLDEFKLITGVFDQFPDELLQQSMDTAEDTILALLKPLTAPDTYDDVPAVREAAISIAVDVLQNKLSGGMNQSPDFQVGMPYRMGAGLVSRVKGVLGKYLDTAGMVG